MSCPALLSVERLKVQNIHVILLSRGMGFWHVRPVGVCMWILFHLAICFLGLISISKCKIFISINMTEDGRNGTFVIGNDRFPVSLLDLPCIVESYKTYDDNVLIKTADVGQVGLNCSSSFHLKIFSSLWVTKCVLVVDNHCEGRR